MSQPVYQHQECTQSYWHLASHCTFSQLSSASPQELYQLGQSRSTPSSVRISVECLTFRNSNPEESAAASVMSSVIACLRACVCRSPDCGCGSPDMWQAATVCLQRCNGHVATHRVRTHTKCTLNAQTHRNTTCQ